MAWFLIHFSALFLLALWVGGGAVLAFWVAPVVFQKAQPRSVARDIFGTLLQRLHAFGLTGGLAAFSLAGLELAGSRGAPRTLTLRVAVIGAMVALAGYGRFVLGPELGAAGAGSASDAQARRTGGVAVLCLILQVFLGALALALGVMVVTAARRM